jgi:rhamnogalacturonyl hydrolase YesR
MASASESTVKRANRTPAARKENTLSKAQLLQSIVRLSNWLERNEYRGYDAFDGLNAWVRPLTFETKLGRTVLQQAVRRIPWNLRPLLGISKSHATKAMGFLASGFVRLHQATNDSAWADKAKFTLQWLIDNQSQGYSGACWGNHFDYQSRNIFAEKNLPTVVWTSHIGHAFLDAYEHFADPRYLEIAQSACEFILRDLKRTHESDNAICIGYFAGQIHDVHNASMLGASLLARTYSHSPNPEYLDLAQKAARYTAGHQRHDASWWYGEDENNHWVDNFHTAYVLDCFKLYGQGAGDHQFDEQMMRGYEYWKRTFFLSDGMPRYYSHKTMPLDIQNCSQAIDTLVLFNDRDPENLPLTLKVARWTIDNMQDRDGHFYYRRYSSWLANKTATLHWGQATMMAALSGLYKLLEERSFA